jgi:splicing factor 3B subunit 1
MSGQDDQRQAGVPLTGVAFDTDLYGGSDRQGYARTAVDNEDEDDQLDEL